VARLAEQGNTSASLHDTSARQHLEVSRSPSLDHRDTRPRTVKLPPCADRLTVSPKLRYRMRLWARLVQQRREHTATVPAPHATAWRRMSIASPGFPRPPTISSSPSMTPAGHFRVYHALSRLTNPACSATCVGASRATRNDIGPARRGLACEPDRPLPGRRAASARVDLHHQPANDWPPPRAPRRSPAQHRPVAEIRIDRHFANVRGSVITAGLHAQVFGATQIVAQTSDPDPADVYNEQNPRDATGRRESVRSASERKGGARPTQATSNGLTTV